MTKPRAMSPMAQMVDRAGWLRMQQAHDLWRAREELRAELDQIPEHTVR